MKEIKVAIVHDYLNQMGGAERVVASFRKLFPDAPIYTTILDEKRLLPELLGADIKVTWMRRIPGVNKIFKLLFWLYPFAVRSMKLQDYDVILSSSSAYAKGIRKPKHAVHVCYCHTPMRFAWDFDNYMAGVSVPGWIKTVSKAMTGLLKRWDRRNSRHVDLLIANSTIVRNRIKDVYGLPSEIVFPPVNVERFMGPSVHGEDSDFSAGSEPNEGYFLVVSRLVSYKRIDLAVEACTRTNSRLVIIGDGPDKQRLQSMAGPSVEFLGRLSDQDVVSYMKRCKALIFPGVEDFGITPLEVNSCGRPVIAFCGGGALDTIRPYRNGLFFEEQTPESLIEALERYREVKWDKQDIERHAQTFNEQRFLQKIEQLIDQTCRKRNLIGVANANKEERVQLNLQ
ncbi:glycosyltransferase [Paenibacillus tarimensis]